MKLLLQEFRDAIRSSKLNTKWAKITVGIVTLLFIAFLIKIIAFPAVKTGVVGTDTDFGEIIDLVAVVKYGDDPAQTTGDTVEEVSQLDSESIETTVLLYFSGANEGVLDLFSSVSDPYQIQNDFILKFEPEELDGKFTEAMNRISRNGQIKKVDIVKSTRLLGLSKFRVVLDIYYKDLKDPVRASVIIKTVEEHEQHHTDELADHDAHAGYEQPYVTSSVWDLIDLIESSVK